MKAECQRKLHRCGAANRVSFDAGKESAQIVSRHRPAGDNFHLLGVKFDCKLLMHDAVRESATESGWRLRALMRTQRYHYDFELVHLYKSHNLCSIEYCTAAISHAASSVLDSLDAIQTRCLRDLDISKEQALTDFGLAP
eukprot:4696418-Alexandrium_andersonii.AAC.1